MATRYIDRMAVYRVIRDNGPMTAADVCKALPDLPSKTVNGAICKLQGDLIEAVSKDSKGTATWGAIR